MCCGTHGRIYPTAVWLARGPCSASNRGRAAQHPSSLSLDAMYAKTLSAIAVVSAAAVAAQANGPQINTPSFVAQCKPVKLTWKGGEPPYHIYVTAPGKIDDVKADLGDQQGTSMTWKVSIPEGQKFTLNLCDKSGQCNPSGQAGPVGSGDDSCLNGGGDKGSSSSGGAAAGGGGSSKSDKDSGDSKSGGGSSKSSDSKSSSKSSDSKSSGSSKSSESPSSSSSGGDKSSSDSSSQPTSSSSGAAGGESGSDSKEGGDDKGSDSKDGGEDKGGKDGAATFSGVPAVVAGVVGIAIAALI